MKYHGCATGELYWAAERQLRALEAQDEWSEIDCAMALDCVAIIERIAAAPVLWTSHVPLRAAWENLIRPARQAFKRSCKKASVGELLRAVRFLARRQKS